MQIGLNVSHKSRFPDWALVDFKVAGGVYARFPLWVGSERQARKRFDSALAYGLTPLPILDRRSFTESQWKNGNWSRAMRRWSALFPEITVIQVGNEADGTGDSSSGLEKDRWFAMLSEARSVWPDRTIVAGALTQIDWSYLDGIQATGVDAVALNPYGISPDDVASIVSTARGASGGMPLWITELGIEHGWAGDEAARAQLHSALLARFAEEGAEVTCIYCGKDDQGPFGLVNGQNEPYESWAAVINAIPAV